MKHKKRILAWLAGMLAVLTLAGAVPGLLSGLASAATSDEILSQIEELKKQQEANAQVLAGLENSLAQNTNELMDLVARKNGIDQQISILYGQIQVVNQQISAYNLLIADKQEKLDLAQERLEKLSDEYKARIRVMEEQGDLNYWSVIFKASSFADLLDRLNMVVEIANSDRKRLEKMKAAAKEVTEAREALLAEKEVLGETKAALEASTVELQKKRAESDALLTQMIAKGEEFDRLIHESEDEQSNLMAEIAKKNEEYDDALYQEWLATSVPPTTVPPIPTTPPNTGSEGVPPCNETWYNPLGNAWYMITDRFGMRIHPILGIYAPHDGIDLAAPAMTPIYATRTGVVVIAGWDNSAGNYVSINHGDGFSSIYMHQTYFVVSVGEFVSAGQLIGYVGTTGGSTGNHLHFGIAYDGRWIDPEDYIYF